MRERRSPIRVEDREEQVMVNAGCTGSQKSVDAAFWWLGRGDKLEDGDTNLCNTIRVPLTYLALLFLLGRER